MFPASVFPQSVYPFQVFPRGLLPAAALTFAQLTAMRAACELLVPETCVVSRRAVVADGQGGQTWTWSNLATHRCRLVLRPRPAETPAEGRLVSVMQWVLILPWSASVGPADRVVIGTRTFEVSGTDSPTTESVERVVFLEEVV